MLGGRWGEVIWIGFCKVDCLRHRAPATIRLGRISAGAFGKGRPSRVLYLPPDHAVYADDALIPVNYLINYRNIVQTAPRQVTYYHAELARPDILLAEVLPAET